ncbi:hypothetical protein [Parahaliea mediterranea]|uniref:Lipoprotein n=1 Tax=Parahaliea mediterranea TaxID=651086 RepID=A0A939IMW9_9GAMM|nr:hypothetical protein [Parahaliea mediterranea]MBN7797970.1 hypothetical protein [Parahaliea mediterranea]
MKRKGLVVATLVALTALAGCSGDEGDDVTINVDGGGTPTPDPDPDPDPGTGSCDNVVEASFVSFNDDCSVGTLSGLVDSDYVLTSDIQWRLSGTVRVGEGNETVADTADVQAIRDAGVDLEIEAGTDIRAFDDGTLLVTRGSRLIADGTAAMPITFSSLDNNYDGLGEWGGVVVQGFAPQYGQGGTGACFGSGEVCNVEGEGGTEVAVYGGNDPADDSGIIRYVRIAEGGLVAGPNNEVNGLTLQGVGHGTIVEYVQVHNNLDDGVEWFGGTVDAKYLVLTGNDDDDIDYDEGYMGNIQYAIIQKDQEKESPTGSNDPRAIEANSSDDEYVPETEAVIANVTIVGGPVNNDDASEAGAQPGMRLRGALTTSIFNTSVQGFNKGCIRIDDADVNGDGSIIEMSNVSLTNILNDCAGGIYTHETADAVNNVVNQTLTYSATFAINEAAAQLSSAPVINAVNNGSGFTFDQTNYVGAVDPSAATGWWEGWTIPGSLQVDGEVVAPADFVSCNGDSSVCTISGTIDEDYTLVAGVEWRLSGEVLVGSGNRSVSNDADVQAVRDAGVTLTVRPGVSVKAFDDGSLLVTRGSKLIANGSAASPITFSSLDDNFDGEGEWGGIIMQGFAPQYGQGGTGACFGSGTVCNVVGEGGTVVGNYGGNDPADDSGSLRYVRIAEGGLVAGPNNEINGLTLQGVGYNTLIEYVQVHGNLDDGIEWFGGTANARYVVLTNNDDDDIDYDEGYKGNVQYAIIRKNPNKAAPTGSNDPRAIEANSSDDDYAPETEATLANILILGSDVNNNDGSDAGAQPGMRLRGALTTAIYNTAVRDFDVGCVRIDDADVNGDGSNIVPSDVTLVNVLGECADGFYNKRAADVEDNAGEATNSTVTIDGAYAITEAAANVAAPGIVATDNGSGFEFDDTTYVGAVEPGTAPADAWWSGWIIEGSLD